MKTLTIFIYLLYILIIQIERQQAVPFHIALIRDVQNQPLSSWYNTPKDIEYIPQQYNINHHNNKHIGNDLLLLQRERRFGNTKYGRSLLYA